MPADIVNASAINFSNGRIRPIADSLARLYKQLKTVVDEWNGKGMAAYFTADASNVIDGSLIDGRTVIQGQDVQALIAMLQGLVTSIEANNNVAINLIAKISVNPD